MPARHRLPDGVATAPTLTDRISLVVAWAIKASDLGRGEIARRMSDYLGAPVSVHMLNGYAAQTRTDHRITLERFMALIAAVEMPELVDFVARPAGCAVVPDAYADLIEFDLLEAELRALQAEKADRIHQQRRSA
ncbi:hypothetical protein AN189_12940 [Loktanella sp. 3ANDIMAR09]|nr:hypothetical protein AN189_12940 [Loktanella sp. 3ANDIMAR09]